MPDVAKLPEFVDEMVGGEVRDPYPEFAAKRAHDPVWFGSFLSRDMLPGGLPPQNDWMVFRYLDCSRVDDAGFQAGAYDFERPGSEASSKALSHLGPARIPFTCEQYTFHRFDFEALVFIPGDAILLLSGMFSAIITLAVSADAEAFYCAQWKDR